MNISSSQHIPTGKFIEVIANIEGLVVVIGILVVDEFHHSWWRMERESSGGGYQDNMMNTS